MIHVILKFTCCRECRLPYLGFEGTNLLRARLSLLEKIIVKFPDVSKGVLVEKVIFIEQSLY